MVIRLETHDSQLADAHSVDTAAGPTSWPPHAIAPPAGFGLVRLDARREIVRQGEPVRSLFEILDGAVMLTATLPDGRRQVLDVLHRGALIGAPLTPVHRATALTLRETRLRRIERAEAEASPVWQERMRADVAQRFARMQDMIVGLGCRSASERIASYYAGLAEGRRTKAGPIELALELTQAELADHLGLTLETVCREIARLKHLGVVEMKGRTRLLIVDPRRLAAFASGAQSPRSAAKDAAPLVAAE